jgi:hypothetical protein
MAVLGSTMPPTFFSPPRPMAAVESWTTLPLPALLASFFDSLLSQTLFCFFLPISPSIPTCRSYRVLFELREFCMCQSHVFHVAVSSGAGEEIHLVSACERSMMA